MILGRDQFDPSSTIQLDALEIWCVHALVSNWWRWWWRRVRAREQHQLFHAVWFQRASGQSGLYDQFISLKATTRNFHFVLTVVARADQSGFPELRLHFPWAQPPCVEKILIWFESAFVFEVRQSKMKLILHIYITAVCRMHSNEVMHIFVVM